MLGAAGLPWVQSVLPFLYASLGSSLNHSKSHSGSVPLTSATRQRVRQRRTSRRGVEKRVVVRLQGKASDWLLHPRAAGLVKELSAVIIQDDLRQ